MNHSLETRETALEWLVRTNDPQFEEWDEFTMWLEEDAANAAAYHDITSPPLARGAAVIGATDVFVSYKAEDRARLRPLIGALEREGFTVWWDTHIGGGAHWREDIQEHLDGAKCVIVVWSRRSVGIEGDFVRDEASRARKRGAYLPVRLDAVEPPLGFGEVQAISLKGWKGDPTDPRFLAITEAVRRRIAGEDIAHVNLGNRGHAMSRRTLVVGSAAAATALAATGGWLVLKSGAANAGRIAVLPFDNLSGDAAQTYFSEGIAEELRSALTRIGMKNARPWTTPAAYAGGGLRSNVDDLLRFEEALHGGRLIGSASVAAMFTDYGHHYGFGSFVENRQGHRLWDHGGNLPGFSSAFEQYPDDGLVVIVLTNVEGEGSERLAKELAGIYFGWPSNK